MLSQYHSKHRTILFGLVGAAALLGLLYVAMLIATDPEDNLVVVNPVLVESEEGRIVTGTVENRTDSSYTDVTVWIELFDTEGTIVATPAVTTSELAADETWEFSIPVEAPGATEIHVRVTSPDNVRPAWFGG